MRKSKVIFLALFAFAFGARADFVSEQEAARAARAWASRGERAVRFQAKARMLRGGAGDVSSVVRYATTNGTPFFAVSMASGETVFMSGDTGVEPVVAFSSEGCAVLDEQSPLWQMLNRDLSSRRGGSAAAAKTWEKLLTADESTAPVEGEDELLDVRVSPMLRTKWAQGSSYTEKNSAAEINCFNYCTPSCVVTRVAYDGTVVSEGFESAVCGCVATAMAQVLKYWEHPVDEIAGFEEECSFPTEANVVLSIFGKADAFESSYGIKTDKLSVQAGAYDWANMPDCPLSLWQDMTWHGTAVTEDECKAIGKLAYDCGVAVGMDYNLSDFGGSGLKVSKAANIGDAFRKRFSYKSAVTCTSSSTLADAKGRADAILANLDAGCPVILLVTGSGGHAVVGDGYGFGGGEETPYVHLNMGWSGQNDVWYNLPYINVSDNPEDFSGFNEIPAVVFNMFPDTNGVEIVSGHVTTGGVSVAGAIVALYADGEEIATTVTTASGVYSFMAAPGRSYLIEAALPDGSLLGEVETGVLSSSTAAGAGNVWGLDMELAPPAARFGGKLFASLSTALSAASRAASADPSAVQAVEIVGEAPLKADFTVDFNCFISATNADARLSPVTRPSGAVLHVVSNETAGATLSLSNVAFAAVGAAMVDVDAGCRLEIAGAVEVEHVRTADLSCLFVAGPIECSGGIVVDCAAAPGEGDQFASFDAAAFPASSAGAGKFVNAANDGLFGSALAGGGLVWANVPCDPSIARVRACASAETNYYYSLDRAISSFGGETELVLMKSQATVSVPLEVTGGLSIFSDPGVECRVEAASTACFSVTGGDAMLTVSNVTFSGYCGDALFLVSGGGSLVLESGAVLKDCTGMNTSAQARSGAVAVKNGSATLRPGSAITGCTVRRRGGGVSLSGSGCVLNLEGGTITGCSAKMAGGGVYAGGGAVVNVSGPLTVKENFSGDDGVPDDIYLLDSATLKLAGELTGDSDWTVGVKYIPTSSKNSSGAAFIAVDGSVSAEAATNSCAFLFNDANVGVEAVVSGDGTALEWTDMPEDDGQVDPAAATVLLVYDGGAATNYYDTIEAAFDGIAPGDVVDVVLLDDVELVSNVVVSADVVLRSAEDAFFDVERGETGAFLVSAGASLSITNAGLYGGFNMCETAFIRVDGGSLALLSDAQVYLSIGTGSRATGAIVVWNGGTFTMEEGSSVLYNFNQYESSVQAQSGVGGGIVISGEGTEARLRGGIVSNNRADRGGGVFVDNGATAYVSGNFTAIGNTTLSGDASNIMVADRARLVLDGEFTGSAGFSEGVLADTNVFAFAEGWRDWADDEDAAASMLTNSAARFRHDLTGAVGAAVTNDTSDALLVWRTSLAEDGSFEYTDGETGETHVYHVVGDGSDAPQPPSVVVVPCKPFTFSAIELQPDGSWLLTLSNGVETCTYTLYTTDELKAVSTNTWDKVGSQTLTADGFFDFSVSPADAKRFWFATGEDGEKAVEP